jgi:Phd_YefM.
MNTIAAQDIKRRGISAVDDLLANGPVHVIKNNEPEYVVLTEERYLELIEAEDEAHTGLAGRCKGRQGEARQRKGTDKGTGAGRLRDVYPCLDSLFYPGCREVYQAASGT